VSELTENENDGQNGGVIVVIVRRRWAPVGAP